MAALLLFSYTFIFAVLRRTRHVVLILAAERQSRQIPPIAWATVLQGPLVVSTLCSQEGTEGDLAALAALSVAHS